MWYVSFYITVKMKREKSPGSPWGRTHWRYHTEIRINKGLGRLSSSQGPVRSGSVVEEHWRSMCGKGQLGVEEEERRGEDGSWSHRFVNSKRHTNSPKFPSWLWCLHDTISQGKMGCVVILDVKNVDPSVLFIMLVSTAPRNHVPFCLPPSLVAASTTSFMDQSVVKALVTLLTWSFRSLKRSLCPVSLSSSQSTRLSWLMVPML